jgi:hypothetical protein
MDHTYEATSAVHTMDADLRVVEFYPLTRETLAVKVRMQVHMYIRTLSDFF